jgi:periplasmic protein TonB
MANRALYEELDAAMNQLMEGTSPRAGNEVKNLVSVAAKLKELPSDDFRACLKDELQNHAMFIAAGRTYRRETKTSKVLQMPRPLFSSGPATYPVSRRNFVASFLAHAAMLALILSSGAWWMQQKISGSQHTTIAYNPSDYVLTVVTNQSGAGGGGGGTRDKTPVPQGKLPKQSMTQITPPAVVLPNEHALIAIAPTVIAPPIMTLKLPDLGDPASRLAGPPSNGSGANGTGNSGGVGSGIGPGVGSGIGGGFGGGVYRVGGNVGAPRILYAPDPDYSEEARKARYQGSVMLWLVVGSDGRTRDVKIARSLGMGLDQKAVDAVRTWKFEPAIMNGKPVAVQINVEVNFRLY